MAYLVIEINIPAAQIADINDKYGLNAGDKSDALNQAMNALAALVAGAQSGTVQLTTKDVSAAVSPTGAGSLQALYS